VKRIWPVLLLLVVAAPGISLRADQTPTFASRTHAVRVDILVTQNGRPVAGLGADDFEIRDNGALQRIDLVSFEQIPLNLILALDVSASVSGERLTHLRQAAAAVLRDLRPADQAALVTFGDAIVIHGSLTHDFATIDTALARAQSEGRTALLDAIYAAVVVGEADAGRALVLVFSDGVDTASWLTSTELLRSAQRSDAVIYGVTAGGATTLLRDLGHATGGNVLAVASMADLQAAFRTVLDEFRHRYLVSYTPTGVSSTGWHTLAVKGKQRANGMRVKARPGYLGDGG
jgi:Ca-activated chloride channel family protein